MITWNQRKQTQLLLWKILVATLDTPVAAIIIYGCNHDKNAWENPEEWDPERFMEDKSDTMELHKSMASRAGKRLYVGAPEAMTISRMAIGRLVQEFEWSLTQGQADDVDINTRILMMITV
ncbi:hypothetical protein POM88_029475 [Heracleum sosnowskyi]|uniref:Uncharacterized protein n=1 Tax=Heracleum sosnowskyi TaxID=360622 RepID=A0AAD8HTQ2_9APIA|nr:hypothetical protein POM88_029475 [Heracleum sosnowskyi]